MDLNKTILVALYGFLLSTLNGAVAIFDFFKKIPEAEVIRPPGSSPTLLEEYNTFLKSAKDGRLSGNDKETVENFSQGLKDYYWKYPNYPPFKIGGPFITFDRPANLMPMSPSRMDVTMELYTRKNPKIKYVIDPNDVSKIRNSNFNNNSDTKFLLGAYLSGNGAFFTELLVPAMLAHCDCNVINVNWLKGSIGTYEQVAANMRVVGVVTGKYIESLNKEIGYDLSRIHLLGPSFGAQVCGYAGEYLKGKVGRITGLDPAGPCFQNTDPVVRLDPTDAIFVDAIHTNSGPVLKLSSGIEDRVGDVDFYPNGGKRQPGCSFNDKVFSFQSLTGGIADIIQCHHVRAVFLFLESLKFGSSSSCTFNSFACSNYSRFKAGDCKDCGTNGENCARMGYYAAEYATANHSLPAPNKFFLFTTAASPYCVN